MITYTFKCSCGKIFDKSFDSLKDSQKIAKCDCGKLGKKILTPHNFVVKGFNAKNGYSNEKSNKTS